MQTALAVRDTTFILTDILVFVTIYFVTMTLLVAGSTPGVRPSWLALLYAWRACGSCRGWRRVARSGRRARADDRPGHRRLHQHRHRR